VQLHPIPALRCIASPDPPCLPAPRPGSHLLFRIIPGWTQPPRRVSKGKVHKASGLGRGGVSLPLDTGIFVQFRESCRSLGTDELTHGCASAGLYKSRRARSGCLPCARPGHPLESSPDRPHRTPSPPQSQPPAPSHVTPGLSILTSRDPPQKKHHAEIRFINKIESMGLDKTQCYQVTCYLTWSPCPSCARELVDFIKAHDHLNLRIFASRLYYHWLPHYQEGLLLLCGSQVPVKVMGLPEFTDCWENFVDHNEPLSFNPSEKLEELDKNSRAIKRQLERIKQSRSVDVLENGLRSLQLGPVTPSSSRRNSR
uniref:single-stranded DNA cytosine deaminase n=1 Tax=Piliocolobus tephrosceles TaxID=591936 RepID=A0A8C9IQQ9_9PRIM